MSLHYAYVLQQFHRVPCTAVVGPSNTGKTLLAKVALSLLGMLDTGLYKKISQAFAKEMLHRSIFFVLNDADEPKIISYLIMQVCNYNKINIMILYN